LFNADLNNLQNLKTDGNARKLDDFKNIYTNTFNLATGTLKSNVFVNKNAKKKIK